MTVLQAKRYQAKKRRPREVRNGAVSCSNQKGGIVPNKSTMRSVENQKDNCSVTTENLYVSGVENAAMRKARFCYKHLPDGGNVINLEDDNGKVYPTHYLPRKHCLSGGWRAFSADHKLAQGDVVVFQLLEPTKFKVYVVRASASEQESRRSKRKVEASVKETEKTSITDSKTVHHKSDEPRNGSDEDFGFDISDGLMVLSKRKVEASVKETEKTSITGRKAVHHKPDEPKNGSDEDFGFDISDGIMMLSDQSAVDFHQVKSFDDFDIVVNGLVINCELSKQLQQKYYELCSSQELFLHQHIPNGLNCRLIAGIIAETINIADAVRSAKFGTQQMEEFVTWENTLSGFEKLGMNVEFILTRLRQLMGLCDHANRCKRLKTERVEVGEEVKALKAKVERSVGRMKRIDEEIKRLENEEDVEVRFTKLVEAPWSM